MNVLTFGIAVTAFTQSWWGLLGVLGMIVGQSFKSKGYISALGGWGKHKLDEVKFIDYLIKPLAPMSKHRGHGIYKHTPVNQLVRWGFTGLALRGFVWSLAIWVSLLPLMNPMGLWGALIGLTMPLCYLLPVPLTKYLKLSKGNIYEYGEVIFGFILWSSVFFSLSI